MADELLIDTAVSPSGSGCVECLASGGWWFHLRRCAGCGHIGCCDSSPSQHAPTTRPTPGMPSYRVTSPARTGSGTTRASNTPLARRWFRRMLTRSISPCRDQWVGAPGLAATLALTIYQRNTRLPLPVPDEAKPAARFPPMPLQDWAATKETLHRFLQIVGKIRLASAPLRNHWWNVPFHLTGRGVTTRPMGADPIFTIDFDFVDHLLVVTDVTGRTASSPLAGQSVASFYESTLKLLGDLGIEVSVAHPEPFDLSDRTPFAYDTKQREYDPFWVNRYWRILSEVGLILEEFAGRFSGKTSPVHLFWHSMDIAVTRFSDREVKHGPDVDPVTREACSRELIASVSGSVTRRSKSRRSTHIPHQNRKGWPRCIWFRTVPNGSPKVGAISLPSATTWSVPWTTRGQLFWSSSSVPTRQGRHTPDGTSRAWRRPMAPPHRQISEHTGRSTCGAND